MDHTLAAWRLVNRFYTFRMQTMQGQAANAQFDAALNALYQRAQTVFIRVLRTSFVMTTQPPMVVKNKISPEVSLLAAIDKLGLETQSVQMTAKIIR